MIVDFGPLTAEQTAEVVRLGLGEMTDNDIIELIVEVCRGDEPLTDELMCSLEEL